MIDRAQVLKVAQLARLELDEAEQERFTRQLQSILGYIEELQELDTRDVPPTTRAIEVNNVMRDDVQVVFPAREAILDNAPARLEDFFRVPRIMEG